MPYALITGASSGIGLNMAKELAIRKYDLLLVARSEEKLKNLQAEIQHHHQVTSDYLVADLSQPDSSSKIINWIRDKDVEILINNAGFGTWGNLEKNNPQELQQLIQLNMVTLMELCQQIIPVFKKRKARSYLLNVASTTAYQAIPALAVYSASKAFVVSLTRALRWELKDSTISVTCFSPGTTSTGFMDRAGMTVNEQLRQTAEKFTMPAEEVARIGIAGMFKRKAEVIPGFINWLSVKLVDFVPKSLTEKIAYNLYRPH